MVKHNNVIPNAHFHKHWANRVKTWFHQPIQKKIRRNKRMMKAAAIAPRPASGSLRPFVHCPTQQYNSKVKLGRGFTLDELKAANISPKFAKTVGICVDHRRTNKSNESLETNVQRLKDYQARLVVFPRKSGVHKNGDATKEQLAGAKQLKGDILPAPKAAPAVTFAPLTEEMKSFRAHDVLRTAINDRRLVGDRLKRQNAKKEE